jgi:hypothetical protein
LAFAAVFLLSILSPMAAIALGLGPMQTMPARASAVGNDSRSPPKAVAGMHRLGACSLASGNDFCDVEIAFRAPAAARSDTASSAIST